MKRLNQKERAIALLAGNGAIVVQAFLVVIGQIVFRPSPLPRLEAGGLMFCLAGIAAVGLWGCNSAYTALENAGSDDPAQVAICDSHLASGLVAVAANIGCGIAAIMFLGLALMFSPGKTEQPASAPSPAQSSSVGPAK